MLFLYYPVTGALLGPESLPFLHDELYDIRGKWYDIGVQIGVDVGTLESIKNEYGDGCLLYTSPSPRDATLSRMPSSA